MLPEVCGRLHPQNGRALRAGAYTRTMDADTTRQLLAAALAVPVARGLWWLSDLLAERHASGERRGREEARQRSYRRGVKIGRLLRHRRQRTRN